MGAGRHFWKARVIDFIALSANAHNQEKQKDWKYKKDHFWGGGGGGVVGVFLFVVVWLVVWWFFLMVGEKNSNLEEMYFKTVHCLFVNIGNYGLH